MSTITTWDERARLDYEALTTEQKVVALERDIELGKEAFRAHIANMRVFVVVAGWNHEGLDEPRGIFSTQTAAREYVAKLRTVHSYDYVEVLEYDIDHLKD